MKVIKRFFSSFAKYKLPTFNNCLNLEILFKSGILSILTICSFFSFLKMLNLLSIFLAKIKGWKSSTLFDPFTSST